MRTESAYTDLRRLQENKESPAVSTPPRIESVIPIYLPPEPPSDMAEPRVYHEDPDASLPSVPPSRLLSMLSAPAPPAPAPPAPSLPPASSVPSPDQPEPIEVEAERKRQQNKNLCPCPNSQLMCACRNSISSTNSPLGPPLSEADNIPLPPDPELRCDEGDLSEVIFLIFTGEKNRERILMSLKTWMTQIKRENIIIVSDRVDADFESLVVEGSYGSHMLSDLKWVPGMKHVWELHVKRDRKYKWLVVGDDDTFFFPRHIAKFIKTKNPLRSALYAHRCGVESFCGGAGWIGSMTLLEEWMSTIDRCPLYDPHPTDIMLSRCLRAEVGYDFTEAKEFGSAPPLSYIFARQYASDKPNGDMGKLISFHYVTGDLARTLWAVDQLMLKPYRRSSCIREGINPLLQHYKFVGDREWWDA